MTERGRPLVVCLVGTDHHPFERLVAWCDSLATVSPDVDVLVQHGLSRVPVVATGREFLGKDEVADILRRAHVAITHGGPGLISEIRAAGLHPLVVPRDPDMGEHVDGHQVRFVARIACSGIVESISSQTSLLEVVSARLARPRGEDFNPTHDAARVAATVQRFGGLVDDLLSGRRRYGGPAADAASTASVASMR